MNQDDRRKYLIKGLLKERPEYENMQIPSDAGEQKMLLRSLMNIRMPRKIDHAFLQIQDAYLSEENEKKDIVTLADISPAIIVLIIAFIPMQEFSFGIIAMI